MANIGYSLYIKYGLGRQPTDEQAKEWARKTNALILEGFEKEKAGSKAAQGIFTDYNTHFYASAADTIDALLSQIGNK